MAAPCNSKWKKNEEAKRFEKCKKKATKKYAEKSENISERVMSHGEESASARQEYYENRAAEAINNFDTAWGQASGSNN